VFYGLWPIYSTIVGLTSVVVFLSFFNEQLENERDEFRQILLRREIHKVEREIVRAIRIEREELERQNQNMQRALDALLAQEVQDEKND
jgi:hypothetical protein